MKASLSTLNSTQWTDVGLTVEGGTSVKEECSQNEEFVSDHWRKRRWITQNSNEAKMRTPVASQKVARISPNSSTKSQNGHFTYSVNRRTSTSNSPPEFVKCRESESVDRFRQLTRDRQKTNFGVSKLSNFVDEMMQRVRLGIPRHYVKDENRILFLESADGLTKVIFTDEVDSSSILDSTVVHSDATGTNGSTQCSVVETPVESGVVTTESESLCRNSSIDGVKKTDEFAGVDFSAVSGLAQPLPLARCHLSKSRDSVFNGDVDSTPIPSYLESRGEGSMTTSFGMESCIAGGRFFVQSLPESLRQAVKPNLPFVQDMSDSALPSLMKTSPTPDSTLATILEFI
eukprot:g1962.t1